MREELAYLFFSFSSSPLLLLPGGQPAAGSRAAGPESACPRSCTCRGGRRARARAGPRTSAAAAPRRRPRRASGGGGVGLGAFPPMLSAREARSAPPLLRSLICSCFENRCSSLAGPGETRRSLERLASREGRLELAPPLHSTAKFLSKKKKKWKLANSENGKKIEKIETLFLGKYFARDIFFQKRRA